MSLGDFAGARAVGEAILRITREVVGPEHPQIVSALSTLAETVSEAGDADAAAAYLQRALAINERVAGPSSPATAMTLNNLGSVERTRGHFAEAEAALARSLAIRERALGAAHPDTASTLGNLAELRRVQGRYGEAAALVQRVLAIYLEAYGPKHARVALAEHKLGGVLAAQGDVAGALVHFERSLAIRLAALGPDHAMTHYSRTLVGEALGDLGRCREGEPLLAIAEPGLLAAFGADHPDVQRTLTARASCDLQAGRTATAVERLTRVAAADDRTREQGPTRGSHRWLLARALWAAGRRPDAIAAAREAAAGLAEAPGDRRELREVQAWLAARAGAGPAPHGSRP